MGGSLENGAAEQPVDWASFLVTSSAFLTPLPTGAGEICGPANVSYKGWAAEQFPADTLQEGRFRRELVARGHGLIYDDRMRVTHVQKLAGFAAPIYHFHDGRTVLAARRQWSSSAPTARPSASAVVSKFTSVQRDDDRTGWGSGSGNSTLVPSRSSALRHGRSASK